IMGPCAGGAVYSPAMTDFVFMVEGSSYMFITGPDVVKTVTGEEVTFEELGGAATHASRSGVAHFVAPDEEACLDDARYLLSFLPQNNVDPPPYAAPTDPRDREDAELDRLIPDAPNKPYDMHDVIRRVVDDGRFLEVHERYAENIVCGFARLGGHVVGVVGNQPRALAGVLDIDSSVKAGRFVRTCDAFNIAWPTAEIAVMGPDGAVNIVFRRELAEADDSERRRAELIADYKERFANPYTAAERGYVDEVIEPRRTRPVLIDALETAL